MWDSSDLDELKDAVETYDRKTVDALCDGLIAWIAASDESLPLATSKQVLSLLRRKRFFAQMRKVADALIQSGETNGNIRRQYAQALIECDDLSAALGVLERLIVDSKDDRAELAEARGLLGRALKQQYVDTGPNLTKARKRALNRAVTAYHDVYKSKPAEYTWHGVNAVALAKRAARDGVTLDAPVDADAIARQLVSVIGGRSSDNVAAWDLATLMEAQVALGESSKALETAREYVSLPGADAFEIGATLRQLKEVWGIGPDSSEAPLLATLGTALLQREGGKVMFRPQDLQESDREQRVKRETFEKVFGEQEGPVKFKWHLESVARARAVGRVEDRFGNAFGSGFVTSARNFFAWADEKDAVFVTNSHVLGRLDSGALQPENAQVRFEAVDNDVAIPVLDLIWESPKSELDTTIVWLTRVPENVELLPLAPAEPPPVFVEASKRRLYIIHYPKGGELALSLHDNTQVGWKQPHIHYRTATENGSSGSPVFDDQWKLVAVHHAGDKEMPRLDGHPGLYEANEGIWIHEIVREASQCAPRLPPGRPRVAAAPALPKPSPVAAPVQTRHGELVFVSYCHADRKFFQELELFLKPLARANRLQKWTDRNIGVGTDWFAAIEQAITDAGVAVLLVTQNYLASDFIDKEEFPRLLQAASDRGLKIIWVAVDHAAVGTTPLAKIQAANDPSRPLRKQSPADRNKFWAELATTIQRAANS
ncbi:MAG TPA: TRAFs-binding domain-containing protein [Polyangiales bacterium]|nr:TRAFs-binding domain-containing protein [Polyangiales bacterium]